MPRQTTSGARLVFEASSLIELERRKLLRKLTSLGSRVVIPIRVARDINNPNVPKSSPLRQWLQQHSSVITRFQTAAENELYMRLLVTRRKLGDGEDSAIAIAFCRALTLVVEDQAARQVAEELGMVCKSVKDVFPPAPKQARLLFVI
jgi:predicted nucleic acid-binding protein